IASGLVTMLIPLVFFVAQAHPVAAQTCPPPFVRVEGRCVLTSEPGPLDHVIIPAPNTILDCQNRKLVASEKGDLEKRSKPEVAIFLNEAENVQIKNCFI